jgi:chromosome segregation ATPase
LKGKSSRWAESAAFQQAEHEKWHSHSQRLNRAYDSKAAQCQQLKTKLEQTEKELKLANDSQRNVQWVMQVLNGENAQLDRRVAVVTAELDKTKCQLESLRKSVRELPLMM